MKKFAHIKDIQRRIFAAMLANMDDSVGAILKKLRSKNLEENTLIFFLSDNGGPTRELTSSNAPLREGKGTVYEGGIRVPFLMQWKGTLPKGRVYQNPVISLDLFATSTALARAQIKRSLDGVNLVPFLTGRNKGTPHQTLYWRLGNKTALRHKNWKLLRNPRRGQKPQWELYHLAEDISEEKDLAATHTAKADELLVEWEKLNAKMIDPIWKPNRK